MTDILTPSKHISLVPLNSIGTRPEPIVPDGVWIEIQGSCIENEAVVTFFFIVIMHMTLDSFLNLYLNFLFNLISKENKDIFGY